MHWPDSITWTAHTEESTTLLDYTTRSSALHYTTLDLDVQHCNRLRLVHIKIYIIKEQIRVTQVFHIISYNTYKDTNLIQTYKLYQPCIY